MEYIELNCKVAPVEPGNEILIAELAELGFESFEESEHGLKAYIQSPLFQEELLGDLAFHRLEGFQLSYTFELIPDQNWNAKWEENYDPVLVDEKVAIRAPFHKPFTNVEYEVIIEPQMSFGTAHHATTAQMIRFLTELDLENKQVLDMGCGTAVLAILASMRGAKHVDAIDNDEWAYNNSLQNIERNKVDNVKVELGDAKLLKGRSYDTIIANINRNILLGDMEAYAACLKKDNVLLLSGFYKEDIPALCEEAEKHGLIYQRHTVDRSWVAGVWKKEA